MNKRTTIHCLIVIAAAIVIMPFQDWQVFGYMDPRHLRGFAVIVLLAVLSEVLPVISTVGRHQINSSIAFIPFFACVLLFPSPAALVAAIVTSGIAQFLVHKRSAVRAAFNTAQGAVSIWVANSFYEVLGGKHAIPVALDLKSLSDIISFAGLAFAFFLMNQVLVSVAIALSKEERMATVLNRVLAPGGANFIYDIVVSPVAVIVALLYSSIEAPGLIIGILPLLIMRHSYAANAKLERANKDLLTVLVKTIETRD